jgi:ATP-binding cassette subfamily B protein
MNYRLDQRDPNQSERLTASLGRLMPVMRGEGRRIALALTAILVTSAASLSAPVVIGHIVDTVITAADYAGLAMWSLLLLAIFLVGLVSSYLQTRTMGGVGRRILFNLRNAIFTKLQELPVAFFNHNRAGDLISRINNDTDKLNQFFAQALVQFLGNAFLIIGAGVLLLVLDVRLGVVALLPAVLVLVVTQLLGAWVKRITYQSLTTMGGLSGEIQESLANFKVIVAFNRLDFFRDRFAAANDANYAASVKAGIASSIFVPLYALASTLGQLVVLAYGIVLIADGQLTVGLLIGFLLYVTSFYTPLRQLASIWSSLQLALAALDRISEVLSLSSDLKMMPPGPVTGTSLVRFENVSFRYPDGKDVLRNVSFTLERGKTYALVGPTGGGKTTTASLMARLYDPTQGRVLLDGIDIRSIPPEIGAGRIGFILQEPFLFSGTVRDNIRYGSDAITALDDEHLRQRLDAAGLSAILARFERGLDTEVSAAGDAMSLGQRQLIAFIRAVLRQPDLLILDEATANIDTVTEQLLGAILEQLPPTTTKVVIAHRLNTIDNADEIFFVNARDVTAAGSMQSAIEMLMVGDKAS